jgi:CRP/FNR family cyclic AMP-dependent transcriptional regulator
MMLSLEELGLDRDQEAHKKRILQQSRPMRLGSRATRDSLVQIARLCRARRRGKLATQGEADDSVFVVASGRIRLERSLTSGRAIHLVHLGRGDFLGDLTLGSRLSPESAVIIEEATLLELPTRDVRELALRDAGVIQVLGAAILERSRTLEDRLESLLLRKVEARLAGFLLHSIERWGANVPEGVVVGTSFRHHEIASMIGTGREWVTMTLMKMRRKRILGAVGRRVLVRSVDELRALAAGETSL